MRIRTAKTLAQRIDLDYFRRATGLRWWRRVLSIGATVAVLLWAGAYAVAGSRKPFSAGPVSRAHAFAERRCDACHTPAGKLAGFRSHVPESACLSCHDAPAHAANQTAPPACSACHRDHAGRIELARVDDRFCTRCHASLETTNRQAAIAATVGRFPSAHPEFAVIRTHATDPGGLLFNHAVHLKADGVRGPQGPEQLQCVQCHRPDATPAGGRRVTRSGRMAPVNFQADCARCHPLFFDESIDAAAPHAEPTAVRRAMRDMLERYIAQHPGEVSNPQSAIRRVPLNFPRPPEPPARNAGEWVDRRLAFDERLMWNKTCAECHVVDTVATTNQDVMPGIAPYPRYLPSRVTARWMPRASFDHAAHQMVACTSCHAAESSRATQDVLMPSQAVCATCHAPSKGAETRCFECHQYHDWTKSRPVTPVWRLGDFK